jgi:SAM-dependent methyltransferase
MAVIDVVKRNINRIGLLYARFVCKREYDHQSFSGINERPIEFRFVFDYLTKTWPKTVLDVGTGGTALPSLMRDCGFVVTAIDNIRDYWPNGMINRHYHVINDDITNTKISKKFDFITCVSVLEHISNHAVAVKSMFYMLNPGGFLILTFPYNERQYVENVYKLPDSFVKEEYPFITQAYSRNELNSWLADNGGIILEQEYWKYFSGEYWTVGEKVCPPVQVTSSELHQLSCVLIKKCM